MKQMLIRACFFSILLNCFSSIYAADRSNPDLIALSRRIDFLEAQQRCIIADLKKHSDLNQSAINALRNDLENVRGNGNNGSIPNDLVNKIEEQQRSLSDSKEIERILIKYGNNVNNHGKRPIWRSPKMDHLAVIENGPPARR